MYLQADNNLSFFNVKCEKIIILRYQLVMYLQTDRHQKKLVKK